MPNCLRYSLSVRSRDYRLNLDFKSMASHIHHRIRADIGYQGLCRGNIGIDTKATKSRNQAVNGFSFDLSAGFP